MVFNQKEFNEFILENNVAGFFEEPITLASGRKSHFYFNWRNILSDVWLTDKLTDFVIDFVKSENIWVDTFYGVPEGATKLGIITQFKWVKQNSNFSGKASSLAMGRAKPKEHGELKDKFFVGIPKGNVVVIEDVTNTGDSLVKTLDNLKNAGINVVSVISLTNRMVKNNEGKSVREAVESKGFKFYNISSASELLPEMYDRLQPGKKIGKAIEMEFEKYGIKEIKLTKENVIDKLIEKIDEKQNPCIIGLDPQIKFFPKQILEIYFDKYGKTSKAVAEAYIEFNKAIIDATHDLVPAFKLNICFYEKYGYEGIRAFEETTKYVKEKECIVIEDAKRNEVGESAKAYAEGHLGEVDMCDGSKTKSLDVDIMVVNPYLGSDGLEPFVNICKEHGKGIFILAKTSNPSSGEFQDRLIEVTVDEKLELERLGISIADKIELYNLIALNINNYSEKLIGSKGYSQIGAVVGATYPKQAKVLRKIMPKSFFLVPGYGAQGSTGKDLINCFNKDGYGAVINSSRGIIFAYLKKDRYGQRIYKDEDFTKAAREATKEMIKDINSTLKQSNKLPLKWDSEKI
jgi:orotidine-5'-phosphate decarboxylase